MQWNQDLFTISKSETSTILYPEITFLDDVLCVLHV